MSLYVRRCVIGGDVGGGKFAPSKNPPILELHPRKKPENYFKKKTQNSQSQFQIFLNGFQRENKNLVLVENPNPRSSPKTEIPYPKKLSKLNHLVKSTILINKLVVNLTILWQFMA